MRIRTIKPEFFLHDGLFDAELEFKLPLRLGFAGLWCCADREGRFKWEPRRLGAQILPYDGIDFSRVLDALVTRGFVVKYGSYGAIPSWRRHQVVNHRERKSVLPAPPENLADFDQPSEGNADACPTRDPRVTETPGGNGKGREGKGKEQRATPLTPRTPTLQQWLEHAQQAHPDWPQGDATSAWEHYESLGWMKRKTPIQRWRSCLETCFRNWASRNAPAQTESMDDFVERMNRPIIPGYRT